MLNGVHVLVFFNKESLNARATHLNKNQDRVCPWIHALSGSYKRPPNKWYILPSCFAPRPHGRSLAEQPDCVIKGQIVCGTV